MLFLHGFLSSYFHTCNASGSWFASMPLASRVRPIYCPSSKKCYSHAGVLTQFGHAQNTLPTIQLASQENSCFSKLFHSVWLFSSFPRAPEHLWWSTLAFEVCLSSHSCGRKCVRTSLKVVTASRQGFPHSQRVNMQTRRAKKEKREIEGRQWIINPEERDVSRVAKGREPRG